MDKNNNFIEVERWIVHYEEGWFDIVEAECKSEAILQTPVERNIEGIWYYDTIKKEKK